MHVGLLLVLQVPERYISGAQFDTVVHAATVKSVVVIGMKLSIKSIRKYCKSPLPNMCKWASIIVVFYFNNKNNKDIGVTNFSIHVVRKKAYLRSICCWYLHMCQ